VLDLLKRKALRVGMHTISQAPPDTSKPLTFSLAIIAVCPMICSPSQVSIEFSLCKEDCELVTGAILIARNSRREGQETIGPCRRSRTSDNSSLMNSKISAEIREDFNAGRSRHTGELQAEGNRKVS